MIQEIEAIQIANSYFSLAYDDFASEVKIPVYKKKWKLSLLNKLAILFKKRADFFGGIVEFEDGISARDYSKIIYPDSWITSNAGYVAVGVKELKYVYVMDISNLFLLENLKYGMRPISSYDYSLFSKPEILIDKGTGEMYYLGFDSPFKEEKEEDFNAYKENKVSKVNWEKYKVA
jgi:hypothetical protein